MRLLALALLLASAACDQLNKPLGHPQSSSSSGSSTQTTDADGGSASDPADGGAAPAFTAQPGDVQL
jgi:hypothetical protein